MPDKDLQNLKDGLSTAQALLWQRIQHGHFEDQKQAEAIFDAHKSVVKAIRLVTDELSQLSLPES